MMRLTGSGSVTLKAVTIGIIVLVLLIPLSMLRGLVSERAKLREHAYTRVAEGWGGANVLGGPILIVPTERTYIEDDQQRTVRSNVYLLPARLDIALDVRLEPEPRKVGIYEVPVYLGDIRLEGEFELAALTSSPESPTARYLLDEARLLLPMSQVRSLREVRSAQFSDEMLTFSPSSGRILPGIESALDLSDVAPGDRAAFRFETTLAGSREISMLPLGSETRVQFASNWPHPSFNGAFLPSSHEIGAEGFKARWQVLELNRPYPQQWVEGQIAEATLLESTFGVALYQPSDIYQRGERAIKYALLFIALTFLTFFAWEQLSGTRLHPLQYLLVGLALSTFYLLLIALSEHVSFGLAYGLGAAALTLLIGAYISGAAASPARGFVAASAMGLVYALLYVLVISEDYALLLGAITLFAALATVMLVTRRVDWYRSREEDQA